MPHRLAGPGLTSLGFLDSLLSLSTGTLAQWGFFSARRTPYTPFPVATASCSRVGDAEQHAATARQPGRARRRFWVAAVEQMDGQTSRIVTELSANTRQVCSNLVVVVCVEISLTGLARGVLLPFSSIDRRIRVCTELLRFRDPLGNPSVIETSPYENFHLGKFRFGVRTYSQGAKSIGDADSLRPCYTAKSQSDPARDVTRGR